MTTYNKTLADAQPGGRVRLGDQAELDRLEFQAWARWFVAPVERDEAGDYVSDFTRGLWCAWQAALSAHPSPGGQDALAALVEACEDMRAASEEIDNGEGLAHAVPYALWNEFLGKLDDAEHGLAAHQPVGDQHPDDLAVDAFAAAMKAKMAEARAKGRGGWEDPTQCSADDLVRMLRDHVEKGDPRDVANFCMMLHQRGEAIAARPPVCGTCREAIQPDAMTGTTCACARQPVTYTSRTQALVPYQLAHALLGDAYNAGTQGIGFGDQAERLFDAMMVSPRAQALDLDELRRAVCVVNVVGQIDGHDVVRRNSVLDVIDVRRQRKADSQAVGNG